MYIISIFSYSLQANIYMKTGKKSKKTPLFLVVLSCCSFVFLYCSQGNIAGGVEVGNPITLSGEVLDYLQQPVYNAKVTLLRPAFIPLRDSVDTLIYQTYTDTMGTYCLKNIPQDIYNLNVADSASQTIAFHSDIALSKDTVLAAVTLYKAGFGAVSIADTLFFQQSFLYVSGTPIYLTIPKPGIYLFPVPYDTVSICYYSLKTNAIIPLGGNCTDTVFITPKDTIDLTGIPNYVIAPVLYAEYNTLKYLLPLVDTIVTDLKVYIYAEGAYSNKSHPLEYQFYFHLTGSDTGFSDWSIGNYSMIADSVDIIWYIASRARSRIDTVTISDWSREYTIFIDRSRQKANSDGNQK